MSFPVIPSTQADACLSSEQMPSKEEVENAVRAVSSARAGSSYSAANTERLVEALLQLSLLRRRQGDLSRTESLAREALHTYQELKQPSAALGSIVFRNMAEVHELRGNLRSAIESYQRVLGYLDAIGGMERTHTSAVCSRLAVLCMRAGNFVHAEEYALRAGSLRGSVPTDAPAAPGVTPVKIMPLRPALSDSPTVPPLSAQPTPDMVSARCTPKAPVAAPQSESEPVRTRTAALFSRSRGPITPEQEEMEEGSRSVSGVVRKVVLQGPLLSGSDQPAVLNA
jgi:hypothetical protein